MPYVNGKTFWPNQKKKIFVVTNCGQLDLRIHEIYYDEHFSNPTERNKKIIKIL